jgi:hypothetical protein
VRRVLSTPAGYGTVLQAPPTPPQPSAPATAVADAAAEPTAAAPQAPTAAAVPSSTLSYSSLADLERCGYRYYLERVLGMPEDRGRGHGGDGGVDARSRGIVVHRLMEAVDFSAPSTPRDEEVVSAAAELALRMDAAERERIAELIAAAGASSLAKRIAAARRVRREHPFAFVLGPREPLVTGVIDLICEEPDGGVLVIDYKSDRVEPGADLEAVLEREYSVQRLLYALAALREGALVVHVAHWFLERPDEPVAAGYTLAERAALEDELSSRLQRAWADPYTVSAHPHRALCATCPGRASLCSWDEEHTLREHPDRSP